MSTDESRAFYYNGPERRTARNPRRTRIDRRHRFRTESLVSDCRSGEPRRREDMEGFVEFPTLYRSI